MKVSFIVTVYNKAVYLPLVLAGLDSQQGDFEREFIIVDDGSTDNSVDLARKWAKGRDNVSIIEQANAGPAAATNTGIAAASGDVIKFADGDDILLPWTTRSLLGLLEQYPEAVVAYSYNVQTYDPAGEAPEDLLSRCHGLMAEQPEPGHVFGHMEKKELFRRSHMNPSCMMVRRQALQNTGGCAEHIFVQDYILELMLLFDNPSVHWKGVVFLAPEEDENRVSHNEAQILHDLNRALGEFFRRRPDALAAWGSTALKRASGRHWRFARRRGNANILSKAFLSYLRAKLIPVAIDPDMFDTNTCMAFRTFGNIRVPANQSESAPHG